MKRIATIIVGIFATLALASPAMAEVPAGGYGDGPIPTVKAQKAACKPVLKVFKSKKASEYTMCRSLAALPSWWINIDGINYKVNSGPTLVKLTVKMMPCDQWAWEFDRHVTRYNANHAHIQV